MTFTIMGRCPDTGRLGVATATRSLAVGARVPHVAPRSGAVAIMAIADERLGHRALTLLAQGNKAPAVIEGLVTGDANPEYRQLGVIDDDGPLPRGACTAQAQPPLRRPPHRRASHRARQRAGRAACAGRHRGWLHRQSRPAAGGPADGRARSRPRRGRPAWRPALRGDPGLRRPDLCGDQPRVDIHPEPVGELRRIYDAFKPALPYYNLRQVDPTVPPLDDWLAERDRRSTRGSGGV